MARFTPCFSELPEGLGLIGQKKLYIIVHHFLDQDAKAYICREGADRTLIVPNSAANIGHYQSYYYLGENQVIKIEYANCYKYEFISILARGYSFETFSGCDSITKASHNCATIFYSDISRYSKYYIWDVQDLNPGEKSEVYEIDLVNKKITKKEKPPYDLSTVALSNIDFGSHRRTLLMTSEGFKALPYRDSYALIKCPQTQKEYILEIKYLDAEHELVSIHTRPTYIQIVLYRDHQRKHAQRVSIALPKYILAHMLGLDGIKICGRFLYFGIQLAIELHFRHNLFLVDLASIDPSEKEEAISPTPLLGSDPLDIRRVFFFDKEIILVDKSQRVLSVLLPEVGVNCSMGLPSVIQREITALLFSMKNSGLWLPEVIVRGLIVYHLIF